jgi:uncharacterized membrane protein YhaH (DUF805 family)
MKWFLKVLRNYAGFAGRARRKEYWMFFLFNVLFSSIAMTIDSNVGTSYKIPTGYDGMYWSYGFINGAYSLLIFIPSLAVAVRRLHDVGKSGWMILLALIPVIGWIWLFVLMVTDSQPGENEYGPNPKEVVSMV